MTLKICPIAIAVGCPKCMLFKVCPVKESLGGYKAPPAQTAAPAKGAAKKKK